MNGFDGWVMDEQEKQARQEYADFVYGCSAEYGAVPSFEEWCAMRGGRDE